MSPPMSRVRIVVYFNRLVFRQFPVDVVVVHLGRQGLPGKIDILGAVESDALGTISLYDVHLGEQLDVGADPDSEPVLRLRLQSAQSGGIPFSGAERRSCRATYSFSHFGVGIDDHCPFVAVYDDGVVVLHEAGDVPQADNRRYFQGPGHDRRVRGAAAHIRDEARDPVEVELNGIGRGEVVGDDDGLAPDTLGIHDRGFPLDHYPEESLVDMTRDPVPFLSGRDLPSSRNCERNLRRRGRGPIPRLCAAF